jgi:outer membrane biosynthesis protein TonB
MLGSIGICLLLAGCGAPATERGATPAFADANDAGNVPLPTPTLVPTLTPAPTTHSVDLLLGPASLESSGVAPTTQPAVVPAPTTQPAAAPAPAAEPEKPAKPEPAKAKPEKPAKPEPERGRSDEAKNKDNGNNGGKGRGN